MLKSFLAAAVSVVTFFASIFAPTADIRNLSDNSDFIPVLRFIAASDSHVSLVGDSRCRRVQKAIRTGYAVADADGEYSGLDAVMFAGDITDRGSRSQYVGFVSSVKSVLREGTEMLAVVANSHDSSRMGKEALSFYSGLAGSETDYHCVINGFHFIGISTSKTDGEQYSEYQRDWLTAQLDAAVADDPSKPIFVTHHEHVKDTVFGSFEVDGWGIDYFADILKKYPQVVDFSGHSHYPLNDPRSIWQGEFTAIGTGSLNYMELTVGTENTIHPAGYRNEAQMWIVEVDAANRVRLRGIDLIKEKQLCEYILDNPANPANREYTPEKQAARSKPPVFAEGARITQKHSVLGGYVFTFPAAQPTDSMPIFLYRLCIYRNDGSLCLDENILPKYYSSEPEDTLVLSGVSLERKESYTAKVYAVTAYGVSSEPITLEFSV